jgi:signal transduction histidine kinase
MSGLGADLPEFPNQPLDAGGWALAFALCAPLAVRRRWPVACAVVTGVAFGLFQCRGYDHSAATLGFPFALYALGAHQARRRWALLLVLTASFVVLAVILRRMGSEQTVIQYAEFYATLLAFWYAGRWMRKQRAAAERHRRNSMGLAVAAERAVIARELHDVVTHHVTAMVLQADAAGMVLTTDPAVASAGLASVSSTGREALVELRHLLRVLDADENGRSPQPAVGQIADLVARTRALGQPVDWREEGAARPAGGGVDLTIYRVVQESLTNAVKYAYGQHTLVRVAYSDQMVAVEVCTDGSATVADVAVGIGRGLAGLRERVSVFGGDFAAGPTPAGGFLIRASIPVWTQA